MRVLLCSNELDHPSQPPTGGIGVFNRIYMANLIRKNLCDIDYFGMSYCNKAVYSERSRLTFFKPVFYYKLLSKVIDNSNIFLLPILFLIDIVNRFHFTRALKKYVIENDIDVVECSDYKGISSLFKLFKIEKHAKLIIRTHGTNAVLSQCNVQKKNVIARFHERIAAASCKNYIYISISSKNAYEECFGRKSNTMVCYNGVEIPSKEGSRSEIISVGARAKINILNFGTQSLSKGIDVLDKVSRLNENSFVSFFLAGKLTNDAKRIIDDNKKLNYLGVLKQDELFVLLENIDVCIFPSKFENCPMSWIEAMSRGIPVIVSDIPVSKEIVECGADGFICNSISEYLQAIADLCDNNVIERMSMQAILKVQREFSLDDMCSKSIDFYNSCDI